MPEPEWESVLAAAARLQELVPEAALVGGSAAALHAHHRVSFDDDHVVEDLRSRFDEVLAAVEDSQGWVTSRIKRPVLILGSLDGVETGIRNLIRSRPLEVEQWELPSGPLRVPTLVEILRVKAWLCLVRNATRDYLDVAALADRLGRAESTDALLRLDDYYEDQQGPGGRRIATQVAKQLAQPQPGDLSDVDLVAYRSLAPRWQEWAAVADACRELAVAILDRLARDPGSD